MKPLLIPGWLSRSGLVLLNILAGVLLAHAIAGALVTETVFAWPGLGRLIIESVAARDYPRARTAYDDVVRSADFQWPEHWSALREAGFLASGARQAHDEAMDAFKAGNMAAAMAGFSRAAAADPLFAEALISRAALRAGRGEKAGALEDYAAALRRPLTAQLKELVDSSRESLLERRRR